MVTLMVRCGEAMMLRITLGFALAFAMIAGSAIPAAAERATSASLASRNTNEFADQTARPHITIHPRTTRPGPNATRQCRSWLAQEYRVSGPVIVPRMQCWWQ